SRRPTVPLDEARNVDAGEGSGGGAGAAALRGQVRDAVATLPPRQRQVLVLKVYEGLKFTEVADVMEISVGTAKAAFFQAVRGLRRRLGAATGGAVGDKDDGENGGEDRREEVGA